MVSVEVSTTAHRLAVFCARLENLDGHVCFIC
jgi:hypothetical protein